MLSRPTFTVRSGAPSSWRYVIGITWIIITLSLWVGGGWKGSFVRILRNSPYPGKWLMGIGSMHKTKLKKHVMHFMIINYWHACDVLVHDMWCKASQHTLSVCSTSLIVKCALSWFLSFLRLLSVASCSISEYVSQLSALSKRSESTSLPNFDWFQ
jgi:hypothetical protein